MRDELPGKERGGREKNRWKRREEMGEGRKKRRRGWSALTLAALCYTSKSGCPDCFSFPHPTPMRLDREEKGHPQKAEPTISLAQIFMWAESSCSQVAELTDSKALLFWRTFSSGLCHLWFCVLTKLDFSFLKSMPDPPPKCFSSFGFSKINNKNLHLSSHHISWTWHIQL